MILLQSPRYLKYLELQSGYYNMRLIPRFFLNLFSAVILPTRFFRLKHLLYKNAGVQCDIDVKFTSDCKIYGNGDINIGSYTWIGIGAEFHVPITGRVSIGQSCDIAPGVKFLCGSHHVGRASRRAGLGTVGTVSVGSGVWIGAFSVLLPGVHLEDGIVVAAGSLVKKGIYPANCLLAGNPAKIMKLYVDED